jgi:very-short-patch-repair endonuclease/endogenous inhibitor of DNA gyrase (YacG/DUF329 family)
MPLSTVKPRLGFRCPQCRQPLANAQIKSGRQFCSRQCKNESQKRKITLTCNGCRKVFFVLPYLKRQTNYCSLGCYRRSTKKKIERVCAICHKVFQVKAYLVKQGFGVYCSRKCQHAAYEKLRIKIVCKQCGKVRIVPPSTARQKASFCSKKCADSFMRDYVTKICKNCHHSFQIPTWETKKGKGSFCSKHCFLQYKGESSIERKVRYALQRAHISFLQEVKIGIYRADFLLPQHNIVIECDGDYWHKIPGIKERDERKNDLLQECGYSTIRLSEKIIREADSDKLDKIIVKIAEPPFLIQVYNHKSLSKH